MKWLPSFTVLFLLAVAGFFLYMGSTIWSLETMGGKVTVLSQLLGILGLLGLLLTIIAPLLILLKFFMRLDQKN